MKRTISFVLVLILVVSSLSTALAVNAYETPFQRDKRIYTEYLINGGYENDMYFERENIIQLHAAMFDIDQNGTYELYLACVIKYGIERIHTTLYTIRNGSVCPLISASDNSSSLYNSWLEPFYDTVTNQHVLLLTEGIADGAWSFEEDITAYTVSNGQAKVVTRIVYDGTDHSGLLYYRIDGVTVSRSDFESRIDAFVPPIDTAYVPLEGSINEPISCEDSFSGYCGENMTWAFNQATGTLYISGLGEMRDYENAEDVPWFAFFSQIETVVIGEGVTYIGKNAFEAAKTLADVFYSGTKLEWEDIDIQNGNSPLSFANISYNHKCAEYSDILMDSWYHTAADFAIVRGIMGSTKTDDLTFEPNTACTRSMIVSILYRLSGSPKVTYEAKFSDVKAGQWYSDAVIWAYQNRIVSGYGDGTFGPNDKITREQMAVILKGYADFKGIDTSKIADLSDFPDANKVTWSKAAIRWAVAEGLISGKASNGKTILDPQGNATRAEVASILMRFVENILEA